MDTATAKKVAKLHNKAFTVDAHFDLTYEVANRRERGATRVVESSYLQQFKDGCFDLIVSSIYVHNFFLPEMGLRKALEQIAFLLEEHDESPDAFTICRTATQARSAKDGAKIGVFLSLEGADPLQDNLQLLRIFYELGVRGLGLVWSRRNYVADGSMFTKQRGGKPGGLTPFGVALIEEAEKLGMYIDISHINDQGFWDVMEVARQPVIASHSNCRTLAGSMRNLTDEQIVAIADKGGVIGMNALNVFIRDNEPDTTISHFLDHVDHIVDIAGIDHVGIGFDLCDSFKNYLQVERPLETFDVIKNHAELALFTAGLIDRGYTDDAILAILGDNFMRVFSQVTG